MEMCPECGEAFPCSNEHHIQDCIEKMHGSLTYLPDHYKRWQTLDHYRDKWDFLPHSLRHRVSEQLMSFDYLWTLQVWLSPKLTIADTQKILATTVIASVYEGVLSEIVVSHIAQRRAGDKLLDQLIYKPKGHYGFERILVFARTIELLDDEWKKYIDTLRQIRNWVHLSNQQKTELRVWLARTEYNDLKTKVDDFRELARPCFGRSEWVRT